MLNFSVSSLFKSKNHSQQAFCSIVSLPHLMLFSSMFSFGKRKKKRARSKKMDKKKCGVHFDLKIDEMKRNAAPRFDGLTCRGCWRALWDLSWQHKLLKYTPSVSGLLQTMQTDILLTSRNL